MPLNEFEHDDECDWPEAGVIRFRLETMYEPDGECTSWGTSTFGGWQTLLISKSLEGKEGYGIFRSTGGEPIAIVRTRELVRPRVKELLAGGISPVRTTRQSTWE